MTDDSETDQATGAKVPANNVREGSALDALMAHLPEKDRQALIKKGIEARLERQDEADRAEQLHYDSGTEMERARRHVKSSSSINADQKFTVEGKTVTGEWKWEVTKNNNMVIIVVAIVIGVVAFLVLTR
jgi:hypothetical protein